MGKDERYVDILICAQRSGKCLLAEGKCRSRSKHFDMDAAKIGGGKAKGNLISA